ncbi:MAG: hypothetical protein WC525_09865, partial [Candidatus Thermoplasmatota archaeon]
MKKIPILLMMALLIIPCSFSQSDTAVDIQHTLHESTTKTAEPSGPLQRLKTTTMVPLRDGIHLATDV